MCRQNEWIVYEEQSYLCLRTRSEETAGHPSSSFNEAYMLHCGNCGFVALHMRYIVEACESAPVPGSDHEHS
jgi:hypothetical protein